MNLAVLPFQIFALLYAIVIHEWAHGYIAHKMGDNTAFYMGRLTLNPVKHIDPIGTLILPAILIVAGSPIVFGWAKPVPVNPNNFKNYKKGELAVSLAGPLANLFSAILFTILGYILMPIARHNAVMAQMVLFFDFIILVNIVLFAFNLIPLPPLDGSHILALFLSPKGVYKYNKIAPYGFYIILALLIFNIIDLYLIGMIKLYWIIFHAPFILHI